MSMNELTKMVGGLFKPGDPETNDERMCVLKDLTKNGKPHSEETNVLEKLKQMVGLDERLGRLGVLQETRSGPISR